MSIESKQLLLNELEEQLSDKLTAKDLKTFLQSASASLSEYDIERRKEDDRADDDYLKAFVDVKIIEGRSIKTIDRYSYILKRMFRAVGAPVPRITTFHLRGYLMQEKERGLGDKTIEGERTVFSSFFGWIWKEGLIEKNPCANIGAVKCAKKIRHPYSDVEIERLKEACDNLRDKAIISFLLSTGCRISEACGLDRESVDFESLECQVLGKGNKERTVYMDNVAAMLLRRYLKSRNDIIPALFIGKGTDRLTPGGARFALKKIAKKAGVDNVHPHRFRRTLATNLINHGMPIQEVAAVLGHDKIDTTMKYVYIEKTNVKNAYRKYA